MLTQALAVACLLATFAGFGLAMRRFRCPRRRVLRIDLLVGGAALCTLAQVAGVALSEPPSPWRLAVGGGMCLLAYGLFGWALRVHGRRRPAFAFLAGPPASFQQSGPYRVVRHPIYSAYLLAWSAGPWLAGRPWLLLPVAVMAACYFRAARTEERSFEASPFAEAYRAYRRRTGMFLPGPSRRAPGAV